MLPATHWIEKDGSFTNSGRWAQWKEQVLPPEGESRHDHWILAEIFEPGPRALPAAGRQVPRAGAAADDAVQGPAPAGARRDRAGDQRAGPRDRAAAERRSPRSRTTAPRPPATGSTRPLPRERQPDQAPRRPAGSGEATTRPAWATTRTGPGAGRSTGGCSTTARRPTRRAVRGTRSGRASSGTRRPSQWIGDVPDYPATADPTRPNAPLPFIMTGEGVGRLFSNGVADGPFPEHYEPVESPIDNPLHPTVSTTPVAFLYDEAAGRPQPVRHVGRLPVRRHVVPAHRARALRHPARRAAGAAAAGGLRRDTGRAGPARRASRTATGCGCRPSAASSRCGRS